MNTSPFKARKYYIEYLGIDNEGSLSILEATKTSFN